MVAQRSRQHPMKMTRGVSINSAVGEAKISEGNRMRSDSLPYDTLPESTTRLKQESQNRSSYQGSRLVLDERDDMDTEMASTTEMEADQQDNPEGGGTLEKRGEDMERINVNVSHVGLADSLQSVEGVITVVSS